MIIKNLGAQLVSAIFFDDRNLFYLSPFAQDSVPIRGGIPIIFPQFGNNGFLKKHGFVRDLEWKKVYSSSNQYQKKASYSLNISKLSNPDWGYEALVKVTFKIITYTSICLKLEIFNIGEDSFSFTGGFHPYFSIKNRSSLQILGLEDSLFIDTDSNISTFNLNDNSGLERLFLTNSNIEVHTGFYRLLLSNIGFNNWMVWNPGFLGAKSIPDLPNEDWDKFVCIEPICHKSVVLAPDEKFEGELKIMVYDKF
jgi:glucose-6-phosphate 1-epimerase